jgi:tetratricopeptide (TPR) repeat protein
LKYYQNAKNYTVYNGYSKNARCQRFSHVFSLIKINWLLLAGLQFIVYYNTNMKIKFSGSGFAPHKFILVFFVLYFSPMLFAQGENTEAILTAAAEHLSRRDFNAALAQFDRFSPEYAGRTEILLLRASILNSAGRTADSRQIASGIIAREPNNTDALMILADAAARDGRDRDRRNFLDQVIAIDPNHVRALNDLGNINLGNRSLRVAAGFFDRALAVDPNNGEALVNRATVHRYNREPRLAEQLLNRAIERYPQWARPLHERARLYRGASFFNDALADLDAARRLEPDNYWVSVDRGLVLMDMDRREDALTEFNRAINIDPNNFLAYVYSAGLKDIFGDFAGAEQDYLILTRLRPDYYFAFEGLGMIRMKNRQWAGARDAFLEAYRQAPREYNYALLAAINWMRAGRQTDPRQFLAQVLRTAPRDSIEFAMLRLFHDLSGDADVAIRVQNERNNHKKAQMLFFLASYYDIRGNTTLANRYFLMVQELDAVASIEWRLNEWVLAERGLGLRAGNVR